jgi:predicted XRE-type DNA-binding protein
MNKVISNSSGNIFIDLGYSPYEAAILQMRADLMADLRKFIKAKKLTQAKAAEILGVSQSRVSDLIRGKWERFSLEMLITLATRAGMNVTLKTAKGTKRPVKRSGRPRLTASSVARRIEKLPVLKTASGGRTTILGG